MAKHGAHVIEPLAAFVQHVVLDHRTHNPRRGFGAQGELLAVQAVFKRIHFFLNDVGHFTQTTHKQSCGLDDGRAQIAVRVTRHEVAHFFLQPLPAGGLRWQ